jgi:hypothetical protein
MKTVRTTYRSGSSYRTHPKPAVPVAKSSPTTKSSLAVYPHRPSNIATIGHPQ